MTIARSSNAEPDNHDDKLWAVHAPPIVDGAALGSCRVVSIHRHGSAFGARDDGEADDLVGPANPEAAGRYPARSGRRKIGQLCDQRALYWLSAAAPGQDAVRSSVARSVWRRWTRTSGLLHVKHFRLNAVL